MEAMNITRLGETKDIGKTALFLASEGGDYIRGETIVVAGKPMARLWLIFNFFLFIMIYQKLIIIIRNLLSLFKMD